MNSQPPCLCSDPADEHIPSYYNPRKPCTAPTCSCKHYIPEPNDEDLVKTLQNAIRGALILNTKGNDYP